MKKISTSWITQWGKDYLYHLKEIFQRKLTAGEGITIDENNVISANGGTANVQSDWNETDTTSDAYILNKPDLNTKQDTLTAGTNITIENNVISASGGGSSAEVDYTVTSADASVSSVSGDCFTKDGIAYVNIRFTTTSAFSALSARTKILDNFPIPRNSIVPHLTLYDITNGDMLHGYVGTNGGLYIMIPPSTGGDTYSMRCAYPTYDYVPIYPELVATVNNTDSASSATVSFAYSGSETITTDNFIKDLTSYYFSGSNKYTSSTTFTSYNNPSLTYTWGVQSGSSRQYFSIYFIEDLTKLHVLSDWTEYSTDGTYTFMLPDEVVDVNSVLIDFRNVKSGGASMSQTNVTKSKSGNTLTVYFPFPSGNTSVSLEARILYLA